MCDLKFDGKLFYIQFVFRSTHADCDKVNTYENEKSSDTKERERERESKRRNTCTTISTLIFASNLQIRCFDATGG